MPRNGSVSKHIVVSGRAHQRRNDIIIPSTVRELLWAWIGGTFQQMNHWDPSATDELKFILKTVRALKQDQCKFDRICRGIQQNAARDHVLMIGYYLQIMMNDDDGLFESQAEMCIDHMFSTIPRDIRRHGLEVEFSQFINARTARLCQEGNDHLRQNGTLIGFKDFAIGDEDIIIQIYEELGQWAEAMFSLE